MNEFRKIICIDISSLKEILEIGHFTLLVLFIGKRTGAGDVQRCVRHVWITGAMCSAANAVLLIKLCFLFFPWKTFSLPLTSGFGARFILLISWRLLRLIKIIFVG